MERQYKYKSRVTANWDRIPKVEGRVIDRGTMTIKDRPAQFIKVETADGEVTVFRSAGLDELFTACEVGDSVSIEYLGTVETSKGREFRQFRSSCWTDDSLPAIDPGKRRGRKATREPRSSRR